MTNSFYFFIVFFLAFLNQLSKFLFFCQTIVFFTSNECFSHFNVQQLSTLKHKSFCFVFTNPLKNNTENESIPKNLFDFIEFRILRYVLHCSIFFGARLENLKINKGGGRGGGPNNSRRSDFFFKKNKRDGRLFGTLE